MSKMKKFYLLIAVFAIGMSMSNVGLATDSPLNLNDARKFFNHPYIIFSKKWMDNQTQLQKAFGHVKRAVQLRPKYDIRYRLERNYYPSDEGLIKNAVSVFGNYCTFQQGFLVSEFQDRLFCVKDERAFAYVSWSSEWSAYGDTRDQKDAILSTRFVMLSDGYANDAYLEAIQYNAPSRILFSD